MAEARSPSSLIPQFRFSKLLRQDQAGRRVVLLGSIGTQPAVLIAERAAFPSPSTTTTAAASNTSSTDTDTDTDKNTTTSGGGGGGGDPSTLATLATSLRTLTPLGANDIYAWFLAHSGPTQPADLKLNLIHPSTAAHERKYAAQRVRVVTETAAVYAGRVRPYMAARREAGALNWVFNIVEGRTEQEDVVYRERGRRAAEGGAGAGGGDEDEGFLLLPDLNWDRKTLTGLHLLGIVERRDLWSLRDLRREHVPWLEHMRRKLIDATVRLYPDIDEDELKLYVHYQPTYYHFHIHVVHASLEAGATQAVGKAFGLENLISQLECMADGKGMADVSLTYTVGEASELWTEIFLPLKTGALKVN